MKQKKNELSGLFTLITVFFFWGFIAASNGVFIPFCKQYFNLTQFESQLIDTAFYGAYYFGGLLLFLYSSKKKVDLINSDTYKDIERERVVDVNINRLRKKIEKNPKSPRYLKTVRSVGYMLVPD